MIFSLFPNYLIIVKIVSLVVLKLDKQVRRMA